MNRRGMPTRADRVFAELRADILAGRQLPGARLQFAELSAHYGASMGVVREALTRLVGEGLVESQPQQGFRVIPLSIEDLQHLTDARCAVEALVLGLAVEHGDVAWESTLVAAHHRLERTPQLDPDGTGRLGDDWVVAHAAYHDALLAGCPNPRLLGVATSLRDSAELYRRWSVPLARTGRDIAGEHRAILDAALAHDVDLATSVLVQHIRATSHVLLQQATGSAVSSATA